MMRKIFAIALAAIISVSAGAQSVSSSQAIPAVPISTANGGLGAANGSASGVPVFTIGTSIVTAATGTGSPVLATGPTLSGAILGATTTLPTSGQISGDGLSIGGTLSTWSATSYNSVIQLANRGAIVGASSNGLTIFSNLNFNDSTGLTYITSGLGDYIDITNGALVFHTAPSGAAGGAATASIVFSVGNTGIVAASGHAIFGGGTPTCGTGCSSVAGKDSQFVVTTGSAVTSVAVNFGTAYTAAPVCTVSSNSTLSFAAIASAPTTTGLTFGLSASLTGGLLYVICHGN